MTRPRTSSSDLLVADYLARLDAAAAGLPRDRRSELREGIEEHIAAARSTGAAPDEASVRTLLDRLGEPGEIVQAARDEPPYAPEPALRTPGTGRETAAVLMLTIGSLLPVVGWLVGVALLWSSRRWTVGEKLLATLVVPLGPGGVLVVAPLAGGVAPARTCASTPDGGTLCTGGGIGLDLQYGGTALAVLVVLAPVVVAALLLRRARQRAALEPPVPVPAGARSPWGGLEISAVLVLGLGGIVVPVLPVFVGLALVLASQAWTRRTKLAAAAVALLPLGVLAPIYTGFGHDLRLGPFGTVLGVPLWAGLAATLLALVLSKRGRAG